MRMTKAIEGDEVLYFGYGSNLDEQDWRQYWNKKGRSVAFPEPVGPAWLADHELAFDYYSNSRGGGALNVRSRVGQVVEGYLFRLNAEEWQALDQKEGAPFCYEKFEATALLPDGREVPVTTYRVRAKRVTSFTQPTEEYLDACRRGRARFGLGTRMLEAVAEGREPDLEVPGLFAYGTLMRGEVRFPLVEQQGLRAASPAQVRGTLHDFGQWPALSLLSDSDARPLVAGELLVPEDLPSVLSSLDMIEGFRGFGRVGRYEQLFRRTLVEVRCDEFTDVQRAWAYVMDDAPARGEPIPGGCWRTHRGVSGGREMCAPRTLYQVQDDEFVAAESPQRLVEYLMNTSIMPVENTAAFRERAAYWVGKLWGARVRTANDAEFVEDMVRVGAYRIVNTH